MGGRGVIRGGPRNDRYEDGMTCGPLVSTLASVPVRDGGYLLLLVVGSDAFLKV